MSTEPEEAVKPAAPWPYTRGAMLVKRGLALGIGLPFLVCGVWLICIFCWAHITRHRVLQWEVVPARIEWVALKRAPHEAVARYSYSFGGRQYVGTRVWIKVRFLDYQGDPQAGRRARILRRHRETGEPFPARVNPSRPEQSLLFCDLDPTSWVALGFGIASTSMGVLVLVGLVGCERQARIARRGQALHPSRPWRWDDRWAGGFALSARGAGDELAAGWVAWLAFGAMIGPVVAVAVIRFGWDGRIGSVPLWPVGLLFLGFWFLLAVLAWRVTARFVKYGVPRLALAEMPIVPGRPVTARVCCTRRVLPRDVFSFTLRGTGLLPTRLGGKRPVAYRHDCTVPVDAVDYSSAGTAVPLTIHVPSDQPPGTFRPGNPAWRLRVSAATRGVNFSFRFDLPVFAVESEELIERAPDFPTAERRGASETVRPRAEHGDEGEDGAEDGDGRA